METEEKRASTQIGRYLIGKTLGHGSFGKVKQATHMYTRTTVAIKIISRQKISTSDMIEKVKREVQVLKMLHHPHIVHLHDVIEAPSDVFLVLELVRGHDLFDFLVSRGRLGEEQARVMFQQIASAMSHCHLHNVVHRDLKPENILLTEDLMIKVADFGLSNIIFDGEFMRTSCGSPNYAAPEIVEARLYSGPEVDVWSLGCILYAMLVGNLPFDDDVMSRLFKRISSGVYNEPNYLSDGSRALLKRMICVDPLERTSFSGIRKDPWFRTNVAPYLLTTATKRMDAKKKLEEELDDEVLHNLVELPAFRPFSLHLTLVKEWLKLGREWKVCGPPPSLLEGNTGVDGKHLKHCANFYLAYELLLEQKIYVESKLQHAKAMEIVGQREDARASTTATRQHKFLAFSPPQVEFRKESNKSEDAMVGRSWFLGIQSKKETTMVMGELFRAMRLLKCQWYVQSPYRIFFRWRPSCVGLDTHPRADVWLYASLQVYKVQSKVDLVDFQRLGGFSNSLAWLNLCTLIISTLKPVSTSSSTTTTTRSLA